MDRIAIFKGYQRQYDVNNLEAKYLQQINQTLPMDELKKDSTVVKGLKSFRKKELIKELFIKHKNLCLKEIAFVLKVSNVSASKCMKDLVLENFVEQVRPSKKVGDLTIIALSNRLLIRQKTNFFRYFL